MRKRFLAAAAALAFAALARGAGAGETWRDETFPAGLEVGETLQVCNTGLMICPAIAPICDDPKVAAPVDTPEGLGFRGVAPGTTLCSALPAGALAGRLIFRITVFAPEDER